MVLTDVRLKVVFLSRRLPIQPFPFSDLSGPPNRGSAAERSERRREAFGSMTTPSAVAMHRNDQYFHS